MTNRDSARHDVLQLGELVRNYINNPKSDAEIKLKNMIIEGYDFVSVLDNLDFETDKEMEEYRKLKEDYSDLKGHYEEREKEIIELKEKEENYKKLVYSLESLIENSLPGKISNLLKEIGKENKIQ
jgi:hypothetical protein